MRLAEAAYRERVARPKPGVRGLQLARARAEAARSVSAAPYAVPK
jgi:hypothetical protein